MYNVTIFGIKMTLNPVAFTLPIAGGWDVYWYGVIIATGFALAMVYGYLNAKRVNLDVDRMLDVVLVATPCAILGARTYYVIFDKQPLGGIKDFFGLDGSGFSGLAIYGGIIGAVLAGVIMCYFRKVKLFDILDLASVAFLIGQGIGRWGNFFNQEAFGVPTGSEFWGMTSENVAIEFRNLGYNPAALAHPCFLYESIWCILGAVILHLFLKKRHFSGEVGLMYCIWYGFGRGFIELLRTDSLMIGSLRVSCILSFAICFVSLGLLIYMRKRHKTKVAEGGYEAMFRDELAAEYAEESTDDVEEQVDIQKDALEDEETNGDSEESEEDEEKE